MNWARPLWLLLLVVVPMLGLLLALTARWHRARLGRLFHGELLERTLPVAVRRRRGVRDVLVVLGIGAAVVALAEPRFDKEIRTIRAKGTDLVIVLDLSRSMDAQDVEPSRLGRARREITDLLRVVEQDRLGLVVVAGGAYPRLPLTLDRGAVALVVNELHTDTFEAQGSALGEGLRVALELLQKGDQAAGRAILVISDGESHDPDDARAAAAEAAAADVPVFTVGVGDGPASIPLADGGFVRDAGEVVTTTPDPELLTDLARITGGAYVRSVASSTDMERLYRLEIRRKLTAVERTATQREVWRSAFQWPLTLSVGLLLLAAWMGDGRRARLGVLAWLLVAMPHAQAADLRGADDAYRAGQHTRAVDELTELSLRHPDDPGILERLGAARYRAGDYEGAARAWEQAVRLGGDDADLLFNTGNALVQSGRLERAVDRYDRALEVDPTHPGANANRKAVEAELAERRKPKPPPPPPQGGEGEDENPSPEDPSEDGPPSDPPPSDGEGEPPPDGEQGEGEPSDPSEGQPPDAEPSDGEPSDGEPSDGSPPQQGEGEGQPLEEAEPITEGEAHRLLEGVEEGRHRVHVGGGSSDKPW